MFIKLFLRKLFKKWNYSLIMVGGLALVLSACMYIYLEVSQELRTDKFLISSRKVYRITYHEKEFGDLPLSNAMVGPALQEEFPNMLIQTRLKHSPNHIVSMGETAFNENKIFYADSTLFDILPFAFAHGDAHTSLRELNSVVISHEAALKYFGSGDALGKNLVLDNHTQLVVTGVLKPLPAKSHIEFDFLLPFGDFQIPMGMPMTLERWEWIAFMTYISVPSVKEDSVINEELQLLLKEHLPEDATITRYALQPLEDIYFGNLVSDVTRSGNIYYVYGLIASGTILLFMAIFNYTNLATALSLTRAREIGVKKTLGYTRTGIIRMLSGEMILMILMSTVCAIGLLFPLTTILNKIFSTNIQFTLPYVLELLTFFVPLAIFTGLVANIYPAVVIASFNPSQVLKGDFRSSPAGVRVRQALMGLQFLLTIVVITISIIVNNQITYLTNKDLGYDTSRIILLNIPGKELKANFAQIRNEFLNYGSVFSVSASGSRLNNYYGFIGYEFEGKEKPIVMSVESAYPDFFSTIGVPVIAGREFDWDTKRDTLNSFIINRSAAKLLGWSPESAINRTITTAQGIRGEIVGVVEDYHAASLYRKIDPMVIYFPRIKVTNLVVAIKPAEIDKTINSLQASWIKLFPDTPFDYSLLNSDLQKVYRSEVKFKRLIGFFSFLTIFIAGIGVYGIVSIFVQYRLKEYSVRIILGASPRHLLSMVFKPFAIVFGISLVMSLPLSIYFSLRWLSTFSYHIDLNAVPFMVATVSVGLGVGLLILTQYTSIAKINPTRTLRES